LILCCRFSRFDKLDAMFMAPVLALVVEALCGSSTYEDGVDANGVTTLQVRRSIYLVLAIASDVLPNVLR
jgi:hypothetical protein